MYDDLILFLNLAGNMVMLVLKCTPFQGQREDDFVVGSIYIPLLLHIFYLRGKTATQEKQWNLMRHILDI